MSESKAAVATVQADNELTRVTEWRFAPGAATGYHVHEHDYVIVTLVTGKLLLSGLDGEHTWDDRQWAFEGYAAMSHVRGDAETITATQTASGRFYQRPDASHLGVDPSRTSLTGFGGRLGVTRRGGLHSEAVASLALRRSGATGSGGGGDSSRDLVVGILAEILRSTQSAPDERAEPAQRRNRAAVIYLRTPISNAFAVTAEISAPDPAGALELAVYQGAGREIGYRLVFLAEGGIELLREGRRRSSVIDFVDDTPAPGGGADGGVVST